MSAYTTILTGSSPLILNFASGGQTSVDLVPGCTILWLCDPCNFLNSLGIGVLKRTMGIKTSSFLSSQKQTLRHSSECSFKGSGLEHQWGNGHVL